MAEQYIYSRAEAGFTNARNQTVSLGYGFVALSPGMNAALEQAVTVHCGECPRLSLRDSEGAFLPLLRKAGLSKGRVLLQKSTWIENSSRDFHVAHGYVLEGEEAKAAGPAGWFAAPFQLGNPNEVEGGILLDSLPEFTGGKSFRADSLKETMGIHGLGLDKQQFCQLLLACFEVFSSRNQVLIACDFEALKKRDLRPGILYWIYTCLPAELWNGLSFDSIYTGKSAPGLVQIAFVDKTLVRAEGRLPGIQMDNQTVSLGSRFLVLDGKLLHDDSKSSAWYGKTGVFARWLEQAVDTLWESSGEKQESVVQAFGETYRNFQRQLSGIPEEKQLDPRMYDAVCAINLGHAPQVLASACERVRGSITKSEQHDCQFLLMDYLAEEERLGILEDILKRHTHPLGEADAAMLCAVFKSGLKVPVTGLLSAIMAEEADAPGGKLEAVLENYRELLPPEIYSLLLDRLFFGELSEEEAPFWERCHVKSDGAAAKRRREKWYKEALPAQEKVWELPQSIEQALHGLTGLSKPQRQADFWQEPFKEQCRAVSKDSLRDFADEKLPERISKLKLDLSKLPGGVPEGALDLIQEQAYGLLLENPAPFMKKPWLDKALNSQKIGGETGETMALLREFTGNVRGDERDIEYWLKCAGRTSGTVRRRVFALLPKMFLVGALPKIWGGFVVSFLHLYPEKQREILSQAAGLGGGKLLLEMLDYAGKYESRLERGSMTDLQAIVRAVRTDGEIQKAAAEKSDKHCAEALKNKIIELAGRN